MPAHLLPWLWAVLVFAGSAAVVAGQRPRSRSMPAAARLAASPVAAPAAGSAIAVIRRGVEALGAAVLQLRPRPAASPSPAIARRAGWAALIATVAFVAYPLAGVVVVAATAAVPMVAGRRRERARQRALVADLPDVVDLFLLAVDAGLTVPLAVTAVAARAPGPLAAEFAVAAGQTGRGRRLADALEQVPGRTSESIRPLIAALVASERYGIPVGTALERLAVEVRIAAQRRAEEAARRVPVTLLFPLVLCILPAFALLTVAPLVANGVRSLRF